MNLRRWLSVILALGLIVALTPIYALAWQNRASNQQFNRGYNQQYHRGFNQQYHRGFNQHQPWGRAYGWHGQRPPMYQHHRQQFRRHYGYGQQYRGYQHNRGPWMSQGSNSRHSGQSGSRGFPPYFTNGQNTSGNWGNYQQGNYQGRYNHQGGYQGGTTPFPTTTTPQPSTGITPQL